MVTTSAAPRLPAPRLRVQTEPMTAAPEHGHGLSEQPVICSILTPSGALLARARVRPRPASLPAESYAVELSDVQPQGALEPLLRSNPQVVLRMPQEPQLALRIDHIIGPRERRTYFLQTLEF